MVSELDYVAIFHSIHRVLRAEQLLKQRKATFLLIPVPRKLTSDCGLALRISPVHLAEVFNILTEVDLLPPELYQLRAGAYVPVEPAAISGPAETT